MAIALLNPLPIRFRCYKVLPLVYTEALSYMEQLSKAIYTINEEVEAINNLNIAVQDIEGVVAQQTAKINEIAENITAFETNINAMVEQMNTTLAEYDERFNEYDARFDNLEDELTRKIDNNVKALKDYIDETLGNIEDDVKIVVEKEIEKIYQSIDNLEQELRDTVELEIRHLIASIPDLTTIEVISPVTGQLIKVQNALDEIFMNTRYFALTVDEFNALQYDVDILNTLMNHSLPIGWSVIQWLTEAKRWLNKNPKLLMNNFISGVKEIYKKNVELNNDLLRVCGCLTTSEFAALNITVDEFNTVGATCEQLAWESNRIFV